MADVRLNLLATMVTTTTTYGMWLPGDVRGYVEDGKILPGDPRKLEAARRAMTGEAVVLSAADRDAAFDGLRRGAEEFGYRLVAVSIESWHTHFLVSHGADAVKTVVGRLKNRMRQAVAGVSSGDPGDSSGGRGRIWAKGYDKRYCFSQREVAARRDYIRRHAGWRALPGEHDAGSAGPH